jgi:hypothetical protein
VEEIGKSVVVPSPVARDSRQHLSWSLHWRYIRLRVHFLGMFVIGVIVRSFLLEGVYTVGFVQCDAGLVLEVGSPAGGVDSVDLPD